MSTLKRAVSVAAAGHKGQVDKAGAPYIEHPLAVMSRLSGEDEMIVAVLHDTLEDTKVTVDLLVKMEFGGAVLEALETMTHRDNEGYMSYITRISGNRLAVRVKLADLLENMRTDRIKDEETRAWHARRLNLYREAFAQLSEVAKSYGLAIPGDPIPESHRLAESYLNALRRLQSGTGD